MKLQDKAIKYHSQFEVQDRNGENIVVFGPDASQELKNSVMKAHWKKLPDDWTFDIYYSILGSLIDSGAKTVEEAQEMENDIIDGLVNIYTSTLTAWLNSSVYNVFFLERAVKELGAKDSLQILAGAQYLAIEDIFQEVLNLLGA